MSFKDIASHFYPISNKVQVSELLSALDAIGATGRVGLDHVGIISSDTAAMVSLSIKDTGSFVDYRSGKSEDAFISWKTWMPDRVMERLLDIGLVTPGFVAALSKGQVNLNRPDHVFDVKSWLENLGLEPVSCIVKRGRSTTVFVVPGTTKTNITNGFGPHVAKYKDGEVHLIKLIEPKIQNFENSEALDVVQDIPDDKMEQWNGPIVIYIADKTSVTTNGILREVLGLEPSPDGKDNKIIAAILKKNGFRKSKTSKEFIKINKSVEDLNDESSEAISSDEDNVINIVEEENDFVEVEGQQNIDTLDTNVDGFIPADAGSGLSLVQTDSIIQEVLPDNSSGIEVENTDRDQDSGIDPELGFNPDKAEESYKNRLKELDLLPDGWQSSLEEFLANRKIVTVAEAIYHITGKNAIEYSGVRRAHVARAIISHDFESKSEYGFKLYKRIGSRISKHEQTVELYSSCQPPPAYISTEFPDIVRIRIYHYEEALFRLCEPRRLKRVEIFPLNFDVIWQIAVLNHFEKLGFIIQFGNRLDVVYQGDKQKIQDAIGTAAESDLLYLMLEPSYGHALVKTTDSSITTEDIESEEITDLALHDNNDSNSLILQMYDVLKQHRDEIKQLKKRVKALEKEKSGG
ncbi:MAG TPA: hypothetical protein VIE65_02100 [Methylobacter sp.]|jgi:hypothetical protein